jgi:hypothetical protein
VNIVQEMPGVSSPLAVLNAPLMPEVSSPGLSSEEAHKFCFDWNLLANLADLTHASAGYFFSIYRVCWMTNLELVLLFICFDKFDNQAAFCACFR